MGKYGERLKKALYDCVGKQPSRCLYVNRENLRKIVEIINEMEKIIEGNSQKENVHADGN